MYRHQNIFQNIALKIYKTAFQFGSEELVIKILIKSNMLSQLLIAYNDVCQNNNQCAKMLHAENFLVAVKEFIKEVNNLQKVHKYYYSYLIIRLEKVSQNSTRSVLKFQAGRN